MARQTVAERKPPTPTVSNPALAPAAHVPDHSASGVAAGAGHSFSQISVLPPRQEEGAAQRETLSDAPEVSVQREVISDAPAALVQRDPPAGGTATPPPAAGPPPTASTDAAPGGAAAPPGVAAGGVTWNMPLSLGTATDHNGAVLGLAQLGEKVRDLQGDLPAELATQMEEDQRAITRMMSDMSTPGPLTNADVSELTLGCGIIQMRYNANLDTLKAQMVAALTRLFSNPVDTSVQEEQMNEDLHNAFIQGADTDRIATLKGGLKTLQDYKDKANSVVTWATRANMAVQSARTAAALKTAGEVVGGIGTALEHVQSLLTVARAFASLSGADGQAAGATQNSINQFRSGMAAIDVAMTFAKAVPLLGQLWSDYYYPLTTACLDLLSKIALHTDLEGRQLGLVGWMSAPRPPGTTPIIPQDLMNFFPGGQPVLDFMYPLVNGGSASPNATVEQFFLQHRSQFNAGEGSNNQLQSESHSHWYNPLSWGENDTAPNLMDWVTRNSDTVWAQLYGSLPHDLR